MNRVLFLCGLLLAGCVAPQPASRPVSARSESVPGPGRVVQIGTLGPCIIYTNTVLHRAFTNCPEPPRVYYLRWNYGPASNITFYVYSSTNLALPRVNWPVKTITANTQLVLALDRPVEFFTVKAYNGKAFSGYAATGP